MAFSIIPIWPKLIIFWWYFDNHRQHPTNKDLSILDDTSWDRWLIHKHINYITIQNTQSFFLLITTYDDNNPSKPSGAPFTCGACLHGHVGPLHIGINYAQGSITWMSKINPNTRRIQLNICRTTTIRLFIPHDFSRFWLCRSMVFWTVNNIVGGVCHWGHLSVTKTLEKQSKHKLKAM